MRTLTIFTVIRPYKGIKRRCLSFTEITEISRFTYPNDYQFGN